MNIYVGNMAYSVTEDELKQLFMEYGPVTKTTVIMDRETGNSKGFGFVEMENQSEGEQAIKDLDGSSISGRDIKVNEARPRNEKPRSRRKSW